MSEFRTSVVEATETNITQIQTRLQEVNQSGVLLSDNIFSWFDDTARANFIAVVGTLDSVDVCFQTLIVLVDSDITAIVETAISGAIARNSELTAFVYSFNDASDYANMQDLVCSTGAVLYNQVGQRLGFGLSDYLNYFVTGKYKTIKSSHTLSYIIATYILQRKSISLPKKLQKLM